MRIIVWGLGYVGSVSAACLAKAGHEVVGVEPNATKVKSLNSGVAFIKEAGLAELAAEMVQQKRLRAVRDGGELVRWGDASLICVGTPSAADGSLLFDHIRSAAVDIGRGLRSANAYHVVILRSTVFPGTVRQQIIPILEEHSGRRAGDGFGVAMNPEFMREATAIKDFYAPPYTVIGELDARSGDLVESLYRGLTAPVHRMSLEEAEVLKLCNNAFHALKTGFANEIGRLCDQAGIDSHAVMRMVCADTKLNISPAYLKPGFAFGGSCLPKDLRSLMFHARRMGVALPILEAILPSNRLQVDAARIKLHEFRAGRIAVLGLSFKPGTDDLRESPVISLIRDLWQDGADVTVFDPDIELDKMLGSNREYLERQLPQIQKILCGSMEDALRDREIVVVNQKRPEFVNALARLNGKTVVLDLVRLVEERTVSGPFNYRGISW